LSMLPPENMAKCIDHGYSYTVYYPPAGPEKTYLPRKILFFHISLLLTIQNKPKYYIHNNTNVFCMVSTAPASYF
jgi:hypothetical protein